MKKNINLVFKRLIEITPQYLDEAEKCAKSNLFFAACVMLGGYLEGLLISWMITYSDPEIDLKELDEYNLFEKIELLLDHDWLDKNHNKKASKFHKEIQKIREVRNFIHPLKLSLSEQSKPEENNWKKNYETMLELIEQIEKHL